MEAAVCAAALASAAPEGLRGCHEEAVPREAEAAPASAAYFLAELDKSAGRPLGIDLDPETLEVVAVDDAGLVADWNQAHPERAILPGCRLLGANGHSGLKAVVGELGKDLLLVLRVAPRDSDAEPGRGGAGSAAESGRGAAADSRPEASALQAANDALRAELAAAEAQLQSLAERHDAELQRLRQECGALRECSLQLQAHADAEARELRAQLETRLGEAEPSADASPLPQGSSLSPLLRASSSIMSEVDLDGTLQNMDGKVTALREVSSFEDTSLPEDGSSQQVQSLRAALAKCEAELDALRQAELSSQRAKAKAEVARGRGSMRVETEKSLLAAQVVRLQAEKQSLKAKADRLASQQRELMRIAAGTNLRRGNDSRGSNGCSEILVVELAEARQALVDEESACRMLREQGPEATRQLQAEAGALREQNAQLLQALGELTARLRASEAALALAEQPVASASSIASAAAVAAAAAQRIRHEVQAQSSTQPAGMSHAVVQLRGGMPGLALDRLLGRGCSISTTCVEDGEATLDPGTERTVLRSPPGTDRTIRACDHRGLAPAAGVTVLAPSGGLLADAAASRSVMAAWSQHDVEAAKKKDMAHSPAPCQALSPPARLNGHHSSAPQLIQQGAAGAGELLGCTSARSLQLGVSRGLGASGVALGGLSTMRPAVAPNSSGPRVLPAVRELSPLARVVGGSAGGQLSPAVLAPMSARHARATSPMARTGASSPAPASRQAFAGPGGPLVTPQAISPQSPAMQSRLSPRQRGRCSVPVGMFYVAPGGGSPLPVPGR